MFIKHIKKTNEKLKKPLDFKCLFYTFYFIKVFEECLNLEPSLVYFLRLVKTDGQIKYSNVKIIEVMLIIKEVLYSNIYK